MTIFHTSSVSYFHEIFVSLFEGSFDNKIDYYINKVVIYK
jgi:hypothetical protein